MFSELTSADHVVGIKQSTRAVLEGKAVTVYVASDADRAVVAPIMELCRKKQIPVVKAPPMKEFGQLLNIEVDAAVAASLLSSLA